MSPPLSLSTASRTELSQRVFGVELAVTIGAPITKTITLKTSRLPVLRAGFKLGTREPDLTNIALIVENMDDAFTWWKSGTLLYNKRWRGASITIDMGGKTDTVQVFAGDLHDIKVRADGTAELICVDPLARTRREQSTTAAGLVYNWFTPSEIARSLLDLANLADPVAHPDGRLDPISWDAAAVNQRLHHILIREFTMPESSWWSIIKPLLDMVNATVRWSPEGFLEYKEFLPIPSAKTADYTIHSDRNMVLGGMVVASPENLIRTRTVVQYLDTDATTFADTPLKDVILTGVETALGRHPIRKFQTRFFMDWVANAEAASLLGWYSDAFIAFQEIATGLDAMFLEDGDMVRVTVNNPTLDDDGIIHSRQILGDRVVLSLYRGPDLTVDWADTGDGTQTLNGNSEVW